ncbi:conserved hypothetical protein [Catenulispora acidiphila DSM 44928]|uniref:Uncharacterized protein n=1 Tax=Catenulispora acidiphila (strain DSM 44928 / JCM 14897 / NBRC 102108 / NRRL B-24433 / ID139908) TaxID=479433 RepID=C7PX12_CATAD|nr:hypothetical protein [Catenulispora acidiphila]ACU77269.1 conserved hypothetical protein [Catenulispora acidiphila DSM 44928]
MSPKRHDDVAPPVVEGEWRIRYANTESVDGWRDLCGKAPGNTRRAYETIRSNPRPTEPTARHHQLKYELAFVVRGGVRIEHWQYEVTGAGRIWYHIDVVKRTLWLDFAGLGHPKATD